MLSRLASKLEKSSWLPRVTSTPLHQAKLSTCLWTLLVGFRSSKLLRALIEIKWKQRKREPVGPTMLTPAFATTSYTHSRYKLSRAIELRPIFLITLSSVLIEFITILLSSSACRTLLLNSSFQIYTMEIPKFFSIHFNFNYKVLKYCHLLHYLSFRLEKWRVHSYIFI